MIYHIASQAEWEAAQTAGSYTAPSLESQGFIHFSGNAGQVKRVADVYYTGQAGLVVLIVDPAKLRADLRYESPDTSIPADHYDGELFPHLYGAINLDAVVAVVELPPNPDGTFTLPISIGG